MARSSRRLGAKMPGVSTKMICAAPSMTMPRTSARVVCTLRETIDTLAPTSALSSVDLPALGAPISATKPQRVSSALRLTFAHAARLARFALARQESLGGGLFGDAFGGAGRRAAAGSRSTSTAIVKSGAWSGPLAVDFR